MSARIPLISGLVSGFFFQQLPQMSHNLRSDEGRAVFSGREGRSGNFPLLIANAT